MANKDDQIKIPKQVGPYRVLKLLGSGSMASVFLAEQAGRGGFRKKLALKIVRPEYADDETFIKLLMREAAIGGLLRHPNIIQTLSFEQYDGRYVLVLEYVSGRTVRQVLRRDRQPNRGLNASLVIDICVQVCRALDYAHALEDDEQTQLKIIHRDLKPSNLMLSEHGVVKIMDFGIARAAASWALMTSAGVVRGTPAYMSPEQVRGDPLDGRSDLFSLGTIFCELITGRSIFRGGKMVDVMSRVANVDIGDSIQQAEALLPGAKAILEKLLAEDPVDRFSRGSEVGSKLKELLIARGGRGQRTASMMTAIDDLSSVTAIAAKRPRASHHLELQSGPLRRPSSSDDEPSLTHGSIEAFIYEERAEVAEESFIFEEFSSDPSAAAIQTEDATSTPEEVETKDARPELEKSWAGSMAAQFFGADTRRQSSGNMGPSDPSEDTQTGFSSFGSTQPPPSHALAPAPPETSSSTDSLEPETPRSAMTETLRAPNATDYGEDDLWSDAPAMGSEEIAQAMNEFAGSEDLEPSPGVEDDELWGSDEDDGPSSPSSVPLSSIEEAERLEFELEPSDTDNSESLQRTAEDLVAVTRIAVEQTTALVAETLDQLPGTKDPKREAQRAKITEGMERAQEHLNVVKSAAAAVAAASDSHEAQDRLREAQEASKSVESALNETMDDGKKAMRMARNAISKAVEESERCKRFIAEAGATMTDLQQLITDVSQLSSQLSLVEPEYAGEDVAAAKEALQRSAPSWQRLLTDAQKVHGRAKNSVKSSRAAQHRGELQALVKKYRPPIEALRAQVMDVLEDCEKRRQEAIDAAEREAAERREIEEARVRLTELVDQARAAAETTLASALELRQSIKTLKVDDATALGELESCNDFERRSQSLLRQVEDAAEQAKTSNKVDELLEIEVEARRWVESAQEASIEASSSRTRGLEAAESAALERAAQEEQLRIEAEEREKEQKRIEAEERVSPASTSARFPPLNIPGEDPTQPFPRGDFVGGPAVADSLELARVDKQRAFHLVKKLESAAEIPSNSDLERLVADARTRAAEADFALEEMEELLASPERCARLGPEALLLKCIKLREQAKRAADETAATVEFAKQLGGLELVSHADVPSPGPGEAGSLTEPAPKQEPEDTPAPTPVSQPTASPESIPAWLSELMEEAKNVPGKAPASSVKPPEATGAGPFPSNEQSARATEQPPTARSEAKEKDSPDPPKRVWKDDWS